MIRYFKYRKIKAIRKFRDCALKIKNADELKSLIMSLDGSTYIYINHGWTVWVSLIYKGEHFVADRVHEIDSLRDIALRIYRYFYQQTFKQ